MGGSSLSGYHTLINSISFNNKAKGIDSNSCPDIQIENCISFDNESYNVALYTSSAANTDYSAKGIISYRKNVLTYMGVDTLGNPELKAFTENLKPVGTQKTEAYNNETTYYWYGDLNLATKGTSYNTKGVTVTDDWFESFELPTEGVTVLGKNEDGTNAVLIGRNANGTINLGNFLKLTDKAAAGVGAKDLDTKGAASDYVTEDSLKQEKKDLAAKGLQVSAIADQTYTGSAIKPTLRVSDGVTYLTAKDYSVNYKNNVNVGTATVTIKGKGNFQGTVTVQFKINPKNISTADVTLRNNEIADIANNKAKTPKVAVLWGKKTLSKKDYTLEYYAKDDYDANYAAGTATKLSTISAAGKYAVVIKGTGNYTGEKVATYVLTDKDHIISKAKVSAIKTQTATGTAIEVPGITVKVGGKTLTQSTNDGEDKGDYVVTYVDNVNPGKATAIITGVNDYAGEKQVYFNIIGTPIARVTVNGLPTKGVEYTGEAVTLEGISLTLNGEKLISGTDYSVSYKNNNKAGTAQIVFTGLGKYTGTFKKSFKIVAHSITDEYKTGTSDGTDNSGTHSGTDAGKDATSGHIIISGLTTTYVKGGAKLANLSVRYYDNESKKTFYLTEGTDYTVTYKNNNRVTKENMKANEKPYVIIRGKGAYTGVVTKEITIKPQQLNATQVVNRVKQSVVLNAPDVIANASVLSKVTVTDVNGKLLTGGKSKTSDYTVTYTYVGGDKDGQVVGAKDKPAAGTEIKVTVTKGNSGFYEGENSVTYKVLDKSKDIKSVKVVQSGIISYTGDKITLEDLAKDTSTAFPLTVTLNGTKLTYGVDYEVVPGSYANNIRKGTAKVTIRGINNYGGQKVINFRISAKTIALGAGGTTDGGTKDGSTKDGGKN
jgi:hypothetical protein